VLSELGRGRRCSGAAAGSRRPRSRSATAAGCGHGGGAAGAGRWVATVSTGAAEQAASDRRQEGLPAPSRWTAASGPGADVRPVGRFAGALSAVTGTVATVGRRRGVRRSDRGEAAEQGTRGQCDRHLSAQRALATSLLGPQRPSPGRQRAGRPAVRPNRNQVLSTFRLFGRVGISIVQLSASSGVSICGPQRTRCEPGATDGPHNFAPAPRAHHACRGSRPPAYLSAQPRARRGRDRARRPRRSSRPAKGGRGEPGELAGLLAELIETRCWRQAQMRCSSAALYRSQATMSWRSRSRA